MTRQSLREALESSEPMRNEVSSLVLAGLLVTLALLCTKLPDPAARSVQATAAILALGLAIHTARTTGRVRARGWEWVVAGLTLMTAGSVAGALESLSFFALASSELVTRLPHLLERVFGLPFGLALLVYGFYKWVPSLLDSTHQTEDYLQKTLRTVEELREELRLAQRDAETSAQKLAEAQSRGAERDICDTLVGSLSCGVALVGPSGRIERANEPFIAMIGAGAAASARLSDLMPSPELAEALERAADGGRPDRLEVELCGRTIDVRLRPYSTAGLVLVAEDVTQQRALEKRESRLAERSAELSRLSALAELVGGAAHELNNPLSVISGYAELLDLSQDGAERAEMIHEISKASGRCKRLVNNLQSFVNQQPSERQCIDINEVMTDVLSLRDYHFRERRIEVVKELKSLPSTVADPHALQRVFFEVVNCAYNSLRDYDGRRRLTVRSRLDHGNIGVEVHDSAPRDAHPDYRDISPMSAASSGSPSSYSLDDAADLVRAHGGDLTITREPSGGTLCLVSLPVVLLPHLRSAPDEREAA